MVRLTLKINFMKTLVKFTIVAFILYVAIAFASLDIAWISFHWFFRVVYLFITVAFTALWSQYDEVEGH
jgi:hypothetical protein